MLCPKCAEAETHLQMATGLIEQLATENSALVEKNNDNEATLKKFEERVRQMEEFMETQDRELVASKEAAKTWEDAFRVEERSGCGVFWLFFFDRKKMVRFEILFK